MERKDATLSTCQTLLLQINIGLGLFVSVGAVAWVSAGYLFSLIALALGTLALFQGAWAQVRLSLHTGAYSFEDMTITLLGPKWHTAINWISLLGSFINSIAIIYVSATSLQGLFFQLFGDLRSILVSHAACTLYIGLTLFPFIIRRTFRGIRWAAYLMISAFGIFALVEILYFITTYSSLRARYSASTFNQHFLPESNFFRTFSKMLVIAFSPTFGQGLMPILYSQKNLTVKSGLKVISFAFLAVNGIFLLITVLAVILFGDLLNSHDTILKAFAFYNRSTLAVFSQLIFCAISIFHVTPYLFICRESLLQLVYNCSQKARKPEPIRPEDAQPLINNERESHFKIMYDRVKPGVFFGVALGLLVGALVVTILLKNILSYLELLSTPYLVFANMILPNMGLLGWRGAKSQRMAVAMVSIGSVLLVLNFLFTFLNLVL